MSDSFTYHMFLPLHTPSRSRVFAMVDQGEGEVVEAVASFETSDQATTVANLLNAVLLGVDNGDRLTSALESAPSSVRASVAQVIERLNDDEASDSPVLAATTIRHLAAGLSLFPTPSCQECEAEYPNGVDDDRERCPACDNMCDDCNEVRAAITPRTAAAMYMAAMNLRDNLAIDVDLNDLSNWPGDIHQQNLAFYAKLRACFDRIADALTAGQSPKPSCIGDELALDLILADGAAFEDDDLVRAVAGWKFDFPWDDLLSRYRGDYEDLTITIIEPWSDSPDPIPAELAATFFEPFHRARVRSV